MDATNSMVHSVTATVANVVDVMETHKLIIKVTEDAGCHGIEKNLNRLFMLFASVNLVKYARSVRLGRESSTFLSFEDGK